ncbi:amidase [Vibrio sp. 10N.261.51.F12]|uniref:amidase n=1 Tax=Vibrio sp. 10N.261.51.F12 TaxID=3229679 RepID=UPI003551E358
MTTQTTREPLVYCTQGPNSLAPTRGGKLDNLTFVFKDLFDVEGFVTGAGNPTWLSTHSSAVATSPLIERLLHHGAQCIGRVQTDELAYSLNGANIHYGTPVNPVAPLCIPGGSSSGSAVAVANHEADFSIGTDTGGSVRVPASYCSLYGLRPTLGKLSLQHCFELSASFDTAGIFTRDLAVMSDVYQALHSDDLTKGSGASSPVTLSERPVARIGIDQDLAALLGQARAQTLQEWSARLTVPIKMNRFLADMKLDLASLSLLFRTIQGYEIIRNHGDWLAQHCDSVDPSIMQRVMWARQITEQQYQAAKAQQADFTQALINEMTVSGAIWVLPTTPSSPPKLDIDGEDLAQYRTELMGLTAIAGLAGLPQLHIPTEQSEHGPFGISLIGLPHSEQTLINFAQHLEKHTENNQEANPETKNKPLVKEAL